MKKYILICATSILLFHTYSAAQVITEEGFYSPLISTFDGKYYNNHLIISQQGLKVFDVTNPGNPVLSGQASYPGNYAYQISVHNNKAYMGEGGSGYFSIYDLTNLVSPVLLGSLIIPSSEFILLGDIVTTDSTAYMSGADSLYVINVSNPSAPELDTTIQVNNTPFGYAKEMIIDSNYLYLLTTQKILIYNISDESSPLFVDSISLTHGYHTGLSADTINHRLFSPWVTSLQDYAGYDAIDVTNPAVHALIFSDSTMYGSGDFGATAYSNDNLIISNGGSVNVFNTSANHGFITNYSGQNVPNATVSVQIQDSVIYNIRRGGFEILRINAANTTFISEMVNDPVLKVFPNPILKSGQTFLYISLKNRIKSNLCIRNVSGTIVYQTEIQEGIDQTSIDIRKFSPGVYFANLKSEEFNLSGKIIIMN